MKGLSYRGLEDFNQMLTAAEDALELDSSFYKAHLIKGEALIELGKLDSNSNDLHN